MIINQSKSIGSQAYNDNFEKIFGTPEERKARRAKEKEAEAELVALTNKSATVMRAFEPFISPVDGKPVTSRAELKAHNAKHGVTDTRDYSEGHFERKREEMKQESLGNTPQAKRERQQLIERQLYRYGVLK